MTPPLNPDPESEPAENKSQEPPSQASPPPLPSSPRRGRGISRIPPAALVPLGLLAAGALGALLLALNHPGHYGIPRCPFRSFTGFLCPGCGSLRAMHHLLHGELALALRLNPLTVLLLPYIGLALGHQSAHALGWVTRPCPRPGPWVGWALAVTVVIFGVGRNLGGWGW
ncbi:MAG: DUF2752 domain-containing protein [Acidobacteriota bacterium]